jgi:hypothetical protein
LIGNATPWATPIGVGVIEGVSGVDGPGFGIDDVARVGIGAASGCRSAIGGIVARNGTVVTGYAGHGVERAIGDGGKRAGTSLEAILEALRNPRRISVGIDNLGRPFEIFYGPNARVGVNPETGEIFTVNPFNRRGVR